MTESTAETIIRPMATADLDRILAIAASLPNAPHWHHSAYFDALNPESTPRRIALIASEADLIVGFAVARVLASQAELETIAIAVGSQRGGLGSRLICDLVSRLKQAGACELLLEVRASNLSALAFYLSLRFTESGTRRAYYVDPVEDAVLMRLQIP